MASANREGRRRRVLRDEPQAAMSGSKSRSKKRTKPYADAALVELQPRITDLIPDRILGLVLVLFLGITSAVVVQAFFHLSVNRLSHIDYQVVSGMDLYGPGTIISWLSSVYLLLAGGAALLVYNTRRHKIDDYFGRYGLWVWIAGICVIASLDATTGLHRVAQYAMTSATGTAMWGDGSIWWIAAYALVGLVVGGRALIDMWPSRGALFLALAGACYGLAATVYLGVFRPGLGPHNMTLHSSAMLLGHFFVLYSFLLYARYVHRVAQGLVGVGKGTKATKTSWWSRQQDRLNRAREERAAARMVLRESKAEQTAAREAAKVQKAVDREAVKAQQAAERDESKARKAAEREAAQAETRAKTLAKHEAKKKAKKQPADQKKEQAARPEAKRSSPIDVRAIRAKKPASQQATSHDDETGDMTVEELEMELLTNPNLSKADRRRLRKQLKERQSQQRQAA